MSFFFSFNMRLYKTPSLTPHRSSLVTNLQESGIHSAKPVINSSKVAMKYMLQQTNLKPIRGRKLFIRSVQRILEQIRKKKISEQDIFQSMQDTIGIFHNLTFMRSVQLKKHILKQDDGLWVTEFIKAGGLLALLTYLEEKIKEQLTLTDAIIINEALQCLRIIMNISDLFKYIISHPTFVNTIAKSKKNNEFFLSNETLSLYNQ